APRRSRRRRTGQSGARVLRGRGRAGRGPSRRRRGRAHGSGRVFRRAWSPGQRAAQRNGDDGGGHDRATHRRSGAARRVGAGADADNGAQSESRRPWPRRRARRRARAGRRPAVGQRMTVRGVTAVVVGAGYPGKRRIYKRMAQLGARVVIVDEAGHWSSQLADDGVAADWLAARIVGDADEDARSVADALSAGGIKPDAVLTFWEEFPPVVARVAAALGLPGNSIEAVDAARSKLR